MYIYIYIKYSLYIVYLQVLAAVDVLLFTTFKAAPGPVPKVFAWQKRCMFFSYLLKRVKR